MDIYKKNRNLVVTVVILVIFNIATLFLLWIGKPKPNSINKANIEGIEKGRIQEVLKEELGFSTEQADKFLELRESHHEKATAIEEELILVKRKMFEEAMYGEKSDISDSLLNLSLEKQNQLELLTFDHFLKLKQICTPEQQKKLFGLVQQLIGPRQNESLPQGGPKDEFRDGMPPPPPRGERSPKGDRPPRRK